jgi:hypothetical protein
MHHNEKTVATDPNPSIVMSVTDDEEDRHHGGGGHHGSAMNATTSDWIDFTVPNKSRNDISNHRHHLAGASLVKGEFRDPPPPPPPPPSTSNFILQPPSTIGLDNEEESYLIRYQHMMAQQEREQMVTLAHLQPLLELLEGLALANHHHHRHHEGPPSFLGKNGNHNIGLYDSRHPFVREISYAALQKALAVIEETDGCYDIIKTDRQFMMVLRMLCEEEQFSHNKNLDSSNKHPPTQISWGEFIQCYRLCVLGMQTLETIPPATMTRTRIKERTLKMLSLFRPNSGNFLYEARRDPLSAVSSNLAVSYDNATSKSRKKMESPRAAYDVMMHDNGRCSLTVNGQQVQPKPRLLFHWSAAFFAGALIVSVWFGNVSPIITQNYSRAVTTMPSPTMEQRKDYHQNSLYHSKPVVYRNDIWKSKNSFNGVTSPTLASTTTMRSSLGSSSRKSSPEGMKQYDIAKNTGLDNENLINTRETSDSRLAGAIGGTVAIMYLLLPILSGGGASALVGVASTATTVIFASLVGHEIRDWIACRWSNLRQRLTRQRNKKRYTS